MENAFKVTLFFPLSDNNGEAFEQATWDWWADAMTDLFKGFTLMGTVNGWWEGHGDENQWATIVVKTETDVEKVRDFLRAARVIFRQEAMYLDWHSVYFEEVV